MKYLILLSLLISCAHNNKVVENAKKLPVKSLSEKKVDVKNTLKNHPELDLEQRQKLEKILIGSLEKLETLRGEESKLVQQIMKKTLVEKGSFNELLALKKALKKVYQAKYENFSSSVDRIKEIVGIDPQNQSISEDIGSARFVRD